MSGRRGWIVASLLLLLGALAGAGAVREHWLPCRGSMLSGSLLRGYAYGADFSDACLQSMTTGSASYGRTARIPCGQRTFSAWLRPAPRARLTVVVATSPWSRPTRLTASAPAVLTAAAGLITASGAGGDALDSAYFWLLFAINLAALVVLVAIGVREEPERRTMWQIALVLLASTAIGFFPDMADYAFMVSFSDANWDTPPGTGYPTVVTVALLSLALLAVTLAPGRSRPVDEGYLVKEGRQPAQSG